MAATSFSELRVGETVWAVVAPSGSGEAPAEPIQNVSFAITAGGTNAEVTQSGTDETVAAVEALASGAATLRVQAEDLFANGLEVFVPLLVLNASRWQFGVSGQTNCTVTVSNGALLIRKDTAAVASITVTAIAKDARDDKDAPTYSMDALVWSTDAGLLTVDSGQGTLTAVFLVTAGGQDTIRLVGDNSEDAAVAGALAATIHAATGITAAFSATDPEA